MTTPRRLVLSLLLLCALPTSARADNPIVRMTTGARKHRLELCESVSTLCAGAAPITVVNFLALRGRGDYENTIFTAASRRSSAPTTS